MLKELEYIYPEGSDITIMNTFYSYPIYDYSKGKQKKVKKDYIIIVYKDNKTGKKNHITIYEPKYTYYMANDGVKIDYNRLFIERDKVHPVEVKFTDLEKSIAENTNNIDFYKQNIYNKQKSENKKLHTIKNVFFSDTNIEDHYRFKFANTYTNNITKITKGYFDIEVDGKFAKGDFVELGECEINCVSFLDESSNNIYTFILRNPDNPLINIFENEYKSGEFGHKEIFNFITNAVGGESKINKYNLTNIKFNLLFYDDEVELISDLFMTIHKCNPDFVEGWNSSAFDIPYIIQRCINLKTDPLSILCDNNYEERNIKNYVDERNINEIAERGDYTFISGDSVFIDQMIQYGSRRKAKIGSIRSFKLDDIGEDEAEVHKLDYSHITNSVTELPWLDFKTFVLYNIMDVIVQKCIEHRTQDLDYIFTKCVNNNTSYKKGHRQTVYLINRFAAEFYKMGYIIGNNVNKWNEKPPKYLGALVGKPLNTGTKSKLKIDDRPIFICDNLQDYDFKSLYPSIELENNIASNTQVGKIEIPEKVYEYENYYGISETQYSRSGEFVEHFVSDNELAFCNRWFNLATFEELLEDADEYFGYECYRNDESKYKFADIASVSYNGLLVPLGTNHINPLIEYNHKVNKRPLIFKSVPKVKSKVR